MTMTCPDCGQPLGMTKTSAGPCAKCNECGKVFRAGTVTSPPKVKARPAAPEAKPSRELRPVPDSAVSADEINEQEELGELLELGEVRRAKRSKPKRSTSKTKAKAEQVPKLWIWLTGAAVAASLLVGLIFGLTQSAQHGAAPKPQDVAAVEVPVVDPNTPQPVSIHEAYTLKRPPQNSQSTAPDKLKSEGTQFSGAAIAKVARADGDRLTGGAHMFLFDTEGTLTLTWIGHCGEVVSAKDIRSGDSVKVQSQARDKDGKLQFQVTDGGNSEKVQFQFWDGVMYRALKPDAETSRPVGEELLREYTLTLPAGRRGQRCLIVSAYKARLAEPGVPNFHPIISELLEARTVPSVKE